MPRTPTLLTLLFASALLCQLGCGPAGTQSSVVSENRERLALKTEPADVLTVYEVREQLLGITDPANQEHPEVTVATVPQPVAIMGQIGGLANPWQETQPEFPFAKRQAVFFLADPVAIAEHAAEGHAHAPGEECSFCAAHAEENSELFAVIRLVDDRGQVLPVDARELLDLQPNDMVVVQGAAQVLPGGMLVVQATGVFVRR